MKPGTKSERFGGGGFPNRLTAAASAGHQPSWTSPSLRFPQTPWAQPPRLESSIRLYPWNPQFKWFFLFPKK